jgi:molybdopterin-guanine dinucleotide biosynthesis protein A
VFHAGAIILAGGRSSRMGSSKAALEWHGSTLLRRITGLAQRTVDGPVVVVGAPGQELPAVDSAVEVVADAREGRGPMEGLAAGLAVVGARAEVAFVSSTDVPLLHPAFIRRVIGGFTDDVDVVLPEIHGFHQPVSAAYRTGLAAAVQALVAGGKLTPRQLFERCRVRRLDEAAMLSDAALTAVDPGLASVRNLNDPDDYASAHAQPAPEIEVRRLAPMGVDRAARTGRVAAWTLGQLADAVGLILDDRVTATLNGDPVPGDRDLPLVAGDAVTFASRVGGPTRVA